MKRLQLAIVVLSSAGIWGTLGCADKPPAAPPTVTAGAPASSSSIASVSPHVGLSEEIATLCNIKFTAKDAAPKFNFDDAQLLPEDRKILERVAACVTTGPLRGRALQLIGHADPRGEAEYNMTLGALRAGSAFDFLTHLGVDPRKLAQSSRGELDATGTTEHGWAHDRRVDILLQH